MYVKPPFKFVLYSRYIKKTDQRQATGCWILLHGLQNVLSLVITVGSYVVQSTAKVKVPFRTSPKYIYVYFELTSHDTFQVIVDGGDMDAYLTWN